MAKFEPGKSEKQGEVSDTTIAAIDFVQARYPRLSKLASIMVHTTDFPVTPPHDSYSAMSDFGNGLVHVIDGPGCKVEGQIETIVHELVHFLQKKRIKPDVYRNLQASYHALAKKPEEYNEHPFEIGANKGGATARRRYVNMKRDLQQ